MHYSTMLTESFENATTQSWCEIAGGDFVRTYGNEMTFNTYNWYMKSKDISDNEISFLVLKIKFPVPPANATNISNRLNFKYKISADTGDRVKASLNNNSIFNTAGGINDTMYNVTTYTKSASALPSGDNLLVIQFAKDGALTYGGDWVIIDEIQILQDYDTPDV